MNTTVRAADARASKLNAPILAEPASSQATKSHDPAAELTPVVPKAQIGTAEFFGFQQSDRVFGFTADKAMNLVTRRLGWLDEPKIAAARGYQFALPLKIGQGTKSFLPPGLLLISGGTEVGKSSFVRALSKVAPIERLLAVEPHDTPEELVSIRYFCDPDLALAHAVKQNILATTPTLYCIDSLRAPLFETTGAASGKGIIMPFFTQLTRCSSQLALAGITVMTTVNPMEEDSTFVQSFLKKLSAASPSIIVLESYVKTGSNETFTGFISMRPHRARRSFTFSTAAAHDVEDMVSEISFDPIPTTRDIGFTSPHLSTLTTSI